MYNNDNLNFVYNSELFDPLLCKLSGGSAGCNSFTFPIPLYLPYCEWNETQKLKYNELKNYYNC